MVEIDIALVKNLVAAQFPHWADLPVYPVASGGWCNRTFHLGETMLVRLPSAERYVAQVEKEHRILPLLAPHLPLPIPAAIALGRPGEGYPWPWSVYRWIEGEGAGPSTIADLTQFAEDLAGFLLALWAIDAADGPPAGTHNFYRGGALAVYDAETRRAIEILANDIDVPLITAIWDRALASTWGKPPVWMHGDITEGNLLVRDGRLSAVIDFGNAGTGDPACDLVIAWTLFDVPSRQSFRERIAMDAQTWERARGWCLWKALITIAGEPGTNPLVVDRHRAWLDGMLADLA